MNERPNSNFVISQATIYITVVSGSSGYTFIILSIWSG